MKRSVAAFLLCFLYLLAITRPVMPFFNHLIHHDYIVEFLCVNKAAPELECEGVCNLTMQLQQQQQQEKQSSFPAISIEKCHVVNDVNLEHRVAPPLSEKKRFYYLNRYSYHFSHRNFRPPPVNSLV